MKRPALVAAAMFIAASSPAAGIEKKVYRCKDFVSDMTAFAADTSITWTEMGANFSQVVGTIVGVYFGRSGDPYDYESEAFKNFQDDVFRACGRSPDEKVAVVALRTPIKKATKPKQPALAIPEQDDAFAAREISQVISAAALCGYELDEASVARFAEVDLPKMSEMARMTFQTAGGAMEIKLSEMSKARRIATCSMLQGLAGKYGLSSEGP